MLRLTSLLHFEEVKDVTRIGTGSQLACGSTSINTPTYLDKKRKTDIGVNIELFDTSHLDRQNADYCLSFYNL